MHFYLLVFLPLALPASARAAPDLKEPGEQAKVMQHLAKVAGEAYDDLPPSEAMDRLSTEALKIEPPDRCPGAQSLHEASLDWDREIRKLCRDFNAWAEPRLRDPARCFDASAAEATDNKRIDLFLKKIVHLEEKIEDTRERSVTKREMGSVECGFHLGLSEQMKFKLTQILRQSIAMANYDVSAEECENPDKQFPSYSREGYDAIRPRIQP